MQVDRRTLLISLAAFPPLVAGQALPSFAEESGDAARFLDISRIITGTDTLTAATASRIEGLLRGRDAAFDEKLGKLSTALSGRGSRDDKLKALDGDNLTFALDIAKPWYLGYVGTPSGLIMSDDSAFATFLEAQGYSKVVDIVPRLTYPTGPAGWWAATPAGVDGSDLHESAKSWSYQPQQDYVIAEPDPAWRAYAAGEYDSVEAARTALKPASTDGGTK
jgi:hypothetical protein